MTTSLRPPFDSPLQARIYALALDQRDRGHLDWEHFLAAVDAQPFSHPVEERWLAVLEALAGGGNLR